MALSIRTINVRVRFHRLTHDNLVLWTFRLWGCFERLSFIVRSCCLNCERLFCEGCNGIIGIGRSLLWPISLAGPAGNRAQAPVDAVVCCTHWCSRGACLIRQVVGFSGFILVHRDVMCTWRFVGVSPLRSYFCDPKRLLVHLGSARVAVHAAMLLSQIGACRLLQSAYLIRDLLAQGIT